MDIRPLLQSIPGQQRDMEFIINMDQTPVFFSMHPKRTLEKKGTGTRTINIRTSSSSTKRATVFVTLTASGQVLTPLVVFKGVPGTWYWSPK